MNIGDYVIFFNKTGKYIGIITEVQIDGFLVKTKAVLNHPKQGDLHHPNKVDVPFFHERKALALNEQRRIPEKMVKPFAETIPEYKDSLIQAVNTFEERLNGSIDQPFSKKSLETLEELKKEYELMYSIQFK